MLGAILGDIVGSVYEFNNIHTKDFPLLTKHNYFTDDTVMTVAVAEAVLNYKTHKDIQRLSRDTVKYMQYWGKKYPCLSYGSRFFKWLLMQNPQPYNSFGNGSAMRVASVGWMADSIDECKAMSKAVTEVTHNHVEGIKGAEAVAVAIFLARQGMSKKQIKDYIVKNYYDIDFTLNEIRSTYKFNESCQKTVPQAFESFFESNSIEDTIRNAISIGGDSDTLACIAGSIAEAYYGRQIAIYNLLRKYLPEDILEVVNVFEKKVDNDV